MKLYWKDAPEWANWLAMDENGSWWYYRDKPVLGLVGWRSSELSELCEYSDFPASNKIEWEKTLEKRL